MILALIKTIITKLKHKKQFNSFSQKYKNKNSHNFTFPVNIFNLDNVSIGKSSYGPICILDYGNIDAKVRIGNFCSIANGVVFLSGGGHNMNCFSTYPFYAYYTDEIEKNTTKGQIEIGDDCWIGLNSIILSGSKIPKGCVIGAGSVVRGSFEPYSIIIGNPAKCVKKRFDDNIIEILNDIDFNNLNNEFIIQNIDKFYSPLDLNLASGIKATMEVDK